MINTFIKKWEEGYKVVIGIKNRSEEFFLMFALRRFYYFLIRKFSDVKQIGNFTGFGLYDRLFLNILGLKDGQIFDSIDDKSSITLLDKVSTSTMATCSVKLKDLPAACAINTMARLRYSVLPS